MKVETSHIKTTDPDYTDLTNPVLKLRFCDVQIANLRRTQKSGEDESIDQPSANNTNDPNFDSWDLERNSQLVDYCNTFAQKVKARLRRNIFLQRICIYSNKIYAVKHPEYAYYLKIGKFTSLFFFLLGGLTLVSAAIIGLLNYRESSKYNYPIQVDFSLLFILSSLCIISSYFFNLAFVLAMRTAEDRKSLYDDSAFNETMPWSMITRATIQADEKSPRSTTLQS